MANATRTDGTEYDTVGVDAVDLHRFGYVTLGDGEVLIFDRDVEDGWIQSASAMAAEVMR